MANYLFEELQGDDQFQISGDALKIKEDFLKTLQEKQADLKFKNSYEKLDELEAKIQLIRQWVNSFLRTSSTNYEEVYVDEVVAIILFGDDSVEKVKHISARETIQDLKGDHPTLKEGEFQFNYHEFIAALAAYNEEIVPAYQAFKKAKQEVTESLKEDLKLEELKPRVLTSFVTALSCQSLTWAFSVSTRRTNSFFSARVFPPGSSTITSALTAPSWQRTTLPVSLAPVKKANVITMIVETNKRFLEPTFFITTRPLMKIGRASCRERC